MKKFLDFLNSPQLLLNLNWQEWLAIKPPYPEVGFSIKEVAARFNRNGYDWDMHGSFYRPEKEVDEHWAFVFFHGGSSGEKIMEKTPDGRPGFASVLASQGFRVLVLTYVGHYAPGGIWKTPVGCTPHITC